MKIYEITDAVGLTPEQIAMGQEVVNTLVKQIDKNQDGHADVPADTIVGMVADRVESVPFLGKILKNFPPSQMILGLMHVADAAMRGDHAGMIKSAAAMVPGADVVNTAVDAGQAALKGNLGQAALTVAGAGTAGKDASKFAQAYDKATSLSTAGDDAVRVISGDSQGLAHAANQTATAVKAPTFSKAIQAGTQLAQGDIMAAAKAAGGQELGKGLDAVQQVLPQKIKVSEEILRIKHLGGVV